MLGPGSSLWKLAQACLCHCSQPDADRPQAAGCQAVMSPHAVAQPASGHQLLLFVAQAAVMAFTKVLASLVGPWERSLRRQYLAVHGSHMTVPQPNPHMGLCGVRAQSSSKTMTTIGAAAAAAQKHADLKLGLRQAGYLLVTKKLTACRAGKAAMCFLSTGGMPTVLSE